MAQQSYGLMHESFYVHRRHKLPGVAHDAVTLYKVQSFSIIAAKDINELAVA